MAAGGLPDAAKPCPIRTPWANMNNSAARRQVNSFSLCKNFDLAVEARAHPAHHAPMLGTPELFKKQIVLVF
jgi:hypothetical protein